MEAKNIDKFDLITCRPLVGWSLKNENVSYTDKKTTHDAPLELKYVVVENLWKELSDDGVMLIHFSTYKDEDLKRLSDWSEKLNDSGVRAKFLADRGGRMMISKNLDSQKSLERI